MNALVGAPMLMLCCRRVPLPRGDILPGCDNLPPPRCVRWAAAVRLMTITKHLRSVQTLAAAPCCSTCLVAGMWRWRVVWTTCSLSHVSRWPGSQSRGTSPGDLFLYKVTSRLNSEITLILTAWHMTYMTSSPANTNMVIWWHFVYFSAAPLLRQCPRWRWEEDPCTQSRWRRS